MIFDHVGIMNDDEAGAVKFYHDLLGLELIRESSVSPELSLKLFSIGSDIKMLVFGRAGLKIEVFIVPGFSRPSPSVSHFGLQVPDLPGLLEKAKAAGVKVISAERGGRTIYFIEDFSANRIEVKSEK